MATTESIETANKITVELLVHGYLRLHILSANTSFTDIPLKVFNILLSTLICNNISTCSMLKNCLDILQQYEQWVNIDKKAKATFVCNIPININDSKLKYSTPTELMETHFDHISNLHGLTYKDYDTLHKHCVSQTYNNNNNNNNNNKEILFGVSNTSIMLNECSSINCLILDEEQKTELEKLTFGIASGGSNESNDFSIHSQSKDQFTIPLQQQASETLETSEHASEAEDHFPILPETMFTGGRHSQINSSVASFLAPNWRQTSNSMKQSQSLRSKWQKHVSTASSTDMSQFISQLSVLSLLPTISDVDNISDNIDTKSNENEQRKSDIVLPVTPNMFISVKSYKFLFEGMNAKSSDSNIGFREVSEMSAHVNPFDLLPQISEPVPDNENKKVNKKYEYEFTIKLRGILNEMDLMGGGVLDMADFSTALMSIIKDDMYDFMSISMKIFEDEKLNKDDMDSAKIDDIITFIINGEQDADIVELRELICEGLEIEMDGNNENENDDEENKIEFGQELSNLELKEKEKTDEPYKPIYSVTNGIQRFGKSSKENKKKNKEKNKKQHDMEKKEKENENEVKNNIESVGVMPKFTITKSITDGALTDMLDRIHVYLFHAVHDVKQIPL